MRFKYIILALLMPLPVMAQIPSPQINLTGNIGTQGFPLINNGTLVIASDANRTMTALETSALYIKVTSSVSLTATRNLVSPAGRFMFTIENATTGGQSIQIIGASGTGVTIGNGQTVAVWNDGTNFVGIGSAGGGGAPSGPCGGALAGTYPNCTIANLGAQFAIPMSDGAGNLTASQVVSDSSGGINLLANSSGVNIGMDSSDPGFNGPAGASVANPFCGSDAKAEVYVGENNNGTNGGFFFHTGACFNDTNPAHTGYNIPSANVIFSGDTKPLLIMAQMGVVDITDAEQAVPNLESGFVGSGSSLRFPHVPISPGAPAILNLSVNNTGNNATTGELFGSESVMLGGLVTLSGSSTTPSGSCSGGVANIDATGVIVTCQSGVLTPVGGGGGSGFPITLGSTSIAASSTTTSVSGLTVDGVSPTTFGFVDPTSSIQTQINTKSPLASPTFTGIPAVPTATPGTNTTQAASTAFVTSAVAAIPSGGTVTNIATTGPITGGPIATSGTIACATCATTSAALNNNFVVLGNNANDLKRATAISTNGIAELTLGSAGTSVGQIDFLNSTSGSVSLTAPPTGALGVTTLQLPVPTSTDTLVATGTTQTLTNKTLTSPILTTPALGTPTALVLTNATGLPNASVIGLGTAALVNTGTSGATVPLLNVNNNNFSGGVTTFTQSGFGTNTCAQGIMMVQSGGARNACWSWDASNNLNLFTGATTRPIIFNVSTANITGSFSVNGSIVSGGTVTSALGTASITSATPAAGVTSVTCQTANCDVYGGTYTVVGGTATTGTFVTLLWPTTTTAWRCQASMNGGGTFLGLGHSVATATGMTVSTAVTILSTTFTFDYSCIP